MQRRKDYFQFRQFGISQNKCAMKVGTDGVLLGAWCPVKNCQEVWDVGCGTGLIALMIAQRTPDDCHITAIEIDPQAAAQAQTNVTNSPWAHRITVINGDVCKCAETLPPPDTMVCNPPYHTEPLHSPKSERAMARHEVLLGVNDLIVLASRHLSEHGTLSLITPASRASDVEWQSAITGLNIHKKTSVVTRATADAQIERILWSLGRDDIAPSHHTLRLRQPGTNEYTSQYNDIVKDFYL